MALLPLPWEIYHKTFSDEVELNKRSVDAFSALIARASAHLELPMRFGTLHALGARHDGAADRPSPQQKQFQLANAWIAQHCDYLVAAWHGDEIGSAPARIADDLEIGRADGDPALRFLDRLGGAEARYSDKRRPGGTWEAVRWWLEPARIPGEMRWVQRYRRSRFVDGEDAPARAGARAGRLVLAAHSADSGRGGPAVGG
jgi:hypothetical protein